MVGYKYNTEHEAINAVNLCDTYYYYPKQGLETQHWTSYKYSEPDGFWYISFDKSIEVVLGQPTEFDVTQSISY